MHNVGTNNPAPNILKAKRIQYLRGCVQFEGWLLSHTAEVGPDLLLVTLVVRVIKVIVVS
jgi:hypothetical protein